MTFFLENFARIFLLKGVFFLKPHNFEKIKKIVEVQSLGFEKGKRIRYTLRMDGFPHSLRIPYSTFPSYIFSGIFFLLGNSHQDVL